MISIGNQITRLSALLRTSDLNEWEQSFMTSIVARTHNGKDTKFLSESQVAKLAELASKHFGDAS